MTKLLDEIYAGNVGRLVLVISGPYEGKRGNILEMTPTTVRVELRHTKSFSAHITVNSDQIKFID